MLYHRFKVLLRGCSARPLRTLPACMDGARAGKSAHRPVHRSHKALQSIHDARLRVEVRYLGSNVALHQASHAIVLTLSTARSHDWAQPPGQGPSLFHITQHGGNRPPTDHPNDARLYFAGDNLHCKAVAPNGTAFSRNALPQPLPYSNGARASAASAEALWPEASKAALKTVLRA